jgi:hypothetical protein
MKAQEGSKNQRRPVHRIKSLGKAQVNIREENDIDFGRGG